jgi:hypothetical protein
MLAGVVVVLALAVALGWFLLGGRDHAHEPTVHRRVNEDIDYSELERAERDVQEAADEDSVRDWGPGAAKPRPPHLL